MFGVDGGNLRKDSVVRFERCDELGVGDPGDDRLLQDRSFDERQLDGQPLDD